MGSVTMSQFLLYRKACASSCNRWSSCMIFCNCSHNSPVWCGHVISGYNTLHSWHSVFWLACLMQIHDSPMLIALGIYFASCSFSSRIYISILPVSASVPGQFSIITSLMLNPRDRMQSMAWSHVIIPAIVTCILYLWVFSLYLGTSGVVGTGAECSAKFIIML